MSAVPPLEASHRQAAEPEKTRVRMNYPVLGMLLVIVTAVLAYGGLYLLLVGD